MISLSIYEGAFIRGRQARTPAVPEERVRIIKVATKGKRN